MRPYLGVGASRKAALVVTMNAVPCFLLIDAEWTKWPKWQNGIYFLLQGMISYKFIFIAPDGFHINLFSLKANHIQTQTSKVPFKNGLKFPYRLVRN